MTDLESPKKYNDCYFYYYSTCTKGDSCTFRHEPSALGCETTCSFWKVGKCINVHCNFRHMELRKNRKSIPCYWESQPSGCKKPHCPFMHASQKSKEDEEGNPVPEPSEPETCNKQANQEFSSSVVDPLVVNFEEESDNECAPTTIVSPKKAHHQQHSTIADVKTLEEYKLERIQAETAAYYSYNTEKGNESMAERTACSLRDRILRRLGEKTDVEQQKQEEEERQKQINMDDVKVLSLDEIRKRKRDRTNLESNLENNDEEEEKERSKKVKRTKKVQLRRQAPQLIKEKDAEVKEIKIKTLAEIKAERKRKSEETARIEVDTSTESEVTSTSKGDAIVTKENYEHKVQCVVAPVKRSADHPVQLKRPKIDDKLTQEQIVSESTSEVIEEKTTVVEAAQETHEKKSVKVDKLDDDFLLDEDDFESSSISISLRAEEDILKDIDSILNE